MSPYLKCVGRVTTLQQAPSRLQLSVRQPRRGCLPWWPKKHTLATLCFKKALWQQGASAQYEQEAECQVKDLALLRRLEADLPVKVKCWTKGRRSSKVLLQVSVCALRHHLECSPADWLAFTATGQEQRLCWQLSQHQHIAPPLESVNVWDSDSEESPLEDSVPPRLESVDLRDSGGSEEDSDDLESIDLWDSDSGESPLEEDVTHTLWWVSEDGGEGGEEEEVVVTFSSPSTGKMVRLPRHTEEEEAEERWRAPPWAWTSQDDLLSTESLPSPWDTERWRGPGAWTSEDDLLSVDALRIVADIIRPVVEKSRGGKRE